MIYLTGLGLHWSSNNSSAMREKRQQNANTDELRRLRDLNNGNNNYTRPEPPRVLSEACEEDMMFTAHRFSTVKKWAILTIIFLVQTSMNFNASVYGNSTSGMAEHFGISIDYTKWGQFGFLVAYGIGSELWAPWSEDFGRWKVLQLSLLLVNLWQIPCALAPNFDIILAFRILGGLSCAGGSVTLGMVSDMWDADDQYYAINFVVLSSVLGSIVGPVAGGFIQAYLSWRWVFWIQLIFGIFVQIIHFFGVPETRSLVMLNREARSRPRSENVIGPIDDKVQKEGSRFEVKEILKLWYRPFHMFLTEPIVLFLSLLSGFADALIFSFLDGFPMVFSQWGFGTVELGLTFIPIGIGYILAWIINLGFIKRLKRKAKANHGNLVPEERLWSLLWIAPLLSVGLAIFTGTSMGPSYSPWIAPVIGGVLIGIANSAIYMGTIDYMVAAYGPYSASATGGNALARDVLAGCAAKYTKPLLENIGKGSPRALQYGFTVLCALSVGVIIPAYVFYFKGEYFRIKSPKAQALAVERDNIKSERARTSRDPSRNCSGRNSMDTRPTAAPETVVVEDLEIVLSSHEAWQKESTSSDESDFSAQSSLHRPRATHLV